MPFYEPYKYVIRSEGTQYSLPYEFLRKFTQACLTQRVKILYSGDWVPDFQLMSANKVKLKRFVQ